MLIEEKLVEGYCLDCGEIKQGYKKTFKLGLCILIIFITYMVLNIYIPDQRGYFNKLFLMGVDIGIVYKNVYFVVKMRCITCNRNLIDF